jgi:hypothetical protein
MDWSYVPSFVVFGVSSMHGVNTFKIFFEQRDAPRDLETLHYLSSVGLHNLQGGQQQATKLQPSPPKMQKGP